MTNKNELRKKILEITTFYGEDGTGGHLLTDEMVDKIINLIENAIKNERENTLNEIRRRMPTLCNKCEPIFTKITGKTYHNSY